MTLITTTSRTISHMSSVSDFNLAYTRKKHEPAGDIDTATVR